MTKNSTAETAAAVCLKMRLKSTMSPARYRHTLGAASFADKLARKHGVDSGRAVLAALLHDCGKEIGKDAMKRMFLKRGALLDAWERDIPPLWHNLAGRLAARERYGVRDPEILRAIYLHSTGGRKMTKLQKIIYISDIAEPNRKFGGADAIRRAALKGLDEGMVLALAQKTMFVLKKRGILHPRSVEAWNELACRKRQR